MMNVDAYKASLFACEVSYQNRIQFCCEAEDKTYD